jgi:hypothetical protein
MAEVTRVTTNSLASLLPDPSQKITGLVAGEVLTPGDAVYIKGSDGRVYKSSGAAATEAAHVDGWVLLDSSIGDPCTPVHDLNLEYGSGLTPGTRYFLSAANPGKLVDAASTGGVAPVAFAVDSRRIHVWQSRY